MNINVQLELVRFPAGSFVLLDDPVSGERRLVCVCDSGTEYMEFLDDRNPATPSPILNVFAPVQWGDSSAMATELMLAHSFDRYARYSAFLSALSDTAAAGDTLTFNRAAMHALEADNFDIPTAVVAGLELTLRARARHSAIAKQAASWVETGAI